MSPKGPCNTPLIRPTSVSLRNKLANNQKESQDKYILPKSDFKHHSASTIADPIPSSKYISGDNVDRDIPQEIQDRAERYYGPQLLIPGRPVSPCMNATDQARRNRRTRIRESESRASKTRSNRTIDSGNLEDITDVLNIVPSMSKPEFTSILNKGTTTKTEDQDWTGDEVLDEADFPDMLLSDDEDSGEEFEMIQNEPITEQNGIASWRQNRYWGSK